MRLNIHDIDFRDKAVITHRGKGEKGRVLPIGQRALKCITHYLEYARPRFVRQVSRDPLFVSERGKPFDASCIAMLFKRYSKRITPHTMRHAFALHVLRGGADIEALRRFLGHSYINTTVIYTRLYPKDLKDRHQEILSIVVV
jgi:integrase/recombinase XerD